MDGGLDFAVKYPFTDTAKAVLGNLELNERIVALAVERIKKALKGETAGKMLLHDPEKKEEIASFAAARMILGHLRNNYITNRFAVNESKIVRGYLDKDSHGNQRLVDSVAEKLGIITTSTAPTGARKSTALQSSASSNTAPNLLLDVPTYLRCSPRSVDYTLINRRIVNGMVEVKEQEKRRLMEEAVKKHIEHIPMVKDPPDIIKEAGKSLLAEHPKNESKLIVKEGDHPPCVMRMLDEVRKHSNLPHQARVYLATYLIAIGMNDDDIIKLFANLPDFSDKVTAYQVNHLRKKGYSVPSCATIMSYGLCCATCGIGHPLRWHELSDVRKREVFPAKDSTKEIK